MKRGEVRRGEVKREEVRRGEVRRVHNFLPCCRLQHQANTGGTWVCILPTGGIISVF